MPCGRPLRLPGTVTSAEVVRDRFDGRSRGFGFVEMATAEEALAAARELNGKELGGRAMRVEAATSTQARRTQDLGGPPLTGASARAALSLTP